MDGLPGQQKMAEKSLFLRRNFALRMHGNLDDFFAESVGE